jgi:hypothetical protein
MGPGLNVLFTLLLGLLIIHFYDTMKNRGLFRVLFLGAVLLTFICDWSGIGVPMIFLSHVLQKNPVKRVVFPVLVVYVYEVIGLLVGLADGEGLSVLPQALFTFVGCTLTIPLLLNYSGKRSRKLSKYFFYAYYPAHLTVIVFIRFYVSGLPENVEFLRGIFG